MSIDAQATNEVLQRASVALQEEAARRQLAEQEHQRIAASLAKEKEQTERTKKHDEAERKYLDQRRETDAKAMQTEIFEMRAIHDLELTRKTKSKSKKGKRPRKSFLLSRKSS